MSKKSLFIIGVISLFSLSSKAQQGIRYNMKMSGLSEIPISSKDSADFFRIIFPPDSSDNFFLVNDYYKNGKPKMIGKTSRSAPNIHLEGANIEYFENGNKKAFKNYINNKAIGEVIEYYPNGTVYITGLYDDYNRMVISECRDSTGNILAKNGNGHCIKYGAGFKRIFAEGNINNGLEEGEWHGKLNDSVTYTCMYEKGQITNGIGYDKQGKEYPFAKIEVEPSFNGGIEKFFSFISSNLRYSKDARKHNIQGKVFATFVVERDGKLSDIKISRGLGYGLDEEVIRMLNLSPPWIPGYQYGIPVRVQYTVPISFTIN